MLTVDSYLEFYRVTPDDVEVDVLEICLGAVKDHIDYLFKVRKMGTAEKRVADGRLSFHVYKLVVFNSTKKFYKMIHSDFQENVSSFAESVGDFSQSYTLSVPTTFKISPSFMSLLGLNVISSQNLKL